LLGGAEDGAISKFEPVANAGDQKGVWKLMPKCKATSQGCYAAHLCAPARRSGSMMAQIAVAHAGSNLSSPVNVAAEQCFAKESPSLNSPVQAPHVSVEETVVQDVAHPDRPAHIHPAEATIIAQVQQAGFIERLVGTAPGLSCVSSAEAPAASPGERVFILQFGSSPKGGRGPQEFREALLHGKQLERFREDLSEAGHPCELPSGALVFVPPEIYVETSHALNGVELRPYNVVIAESLEYIVEEVLIKMPYRKRPKVKSPRQVLDLQSRCCKDVPKSSAATYATSSHSGSSSSNEAAMMQAGDCSKDSGDDLVVEVVSKTFLAFIPAFRDRTSVVQSSTDSAGMRAMKPSDRGFNPRRIN